MSDLKFVRTTATNKILGMTKRNRIVCGGSSSSKTYSILAILIDYALKNPKSDIYVVSQTIPHSRKGAQKDFKNIMQMTNRWIDNQWNASTFTYTFGNKSIIEFISGDSAEKIRGVRSTVLFFNEANLLDYTIYQQLIMRCKSHAYIDYNPSHESWVETEVMNQSNAEFIRLTYQDNEALDPIIVEELESYIPKANTSKYWENFVKVYVYGLPGIIEGTIYDNYEVIDTIPEEARLLGCGLDFGYTNDPSVGIAVYKWNDYYILDEVFYQTKMFNSDIASKFKLYGISKLPVIADSAEPKSIGEIQLMGLNILPATKGPDSIINGIQKVQAMKLLVTKNSVNLLKELKLYSWDKDKYGNTLNNPTGPDHGCDSMRYFLTSKFISAALGKYNIGGMKAKNH